MTNGQRLKKILGLENFLEVWIARAIVQSSKPVYVIWYDSKRAESPLPKRRFFNLPYQAMIYTGSDLNHGQFKTPVFTPPLKLEIWGGNIQTGLFITVDVAYTKLLKSKKFETLPENFKKQVISYNQFYLKESGSLKEYVTFNDLQNAKVIAPSTMKHRQIRNKAVGTENTTAKFIDVFINEADKSVTFAFKTKATIPVYPDDYKFKRVSPLNLELLSNQEKQYEIQIKILDFFDWLSTHPEGQPITVKDLKEILQVSNIQVFSTSPSWQYQGYNFWMSQLDGSAYPTDIAPKVWDKRLGGEFFLDKHLYGLIRQINFFLNPMASMITKKLKDRGLI